ncbi:Retrotransposon gag protein [Melia azedarach]|uniref:Retrotransposon gag protein n=1 Tax=Melia azedarach TaxID=155640 RepID=A0ACC1XVR2_MELAZ|nr:Retrotransposon gag protein [Melia azedarach]
MRKAGSSVILLFDIEIERTCRRNRKEKRVASTQQTSTMDPNIGNNDGANDQRVLRDYAIPTVNGASTSIRRPAIQANNFEIKPAIIQMIQTSVQCNGLAHEDPNAHITNFLEICDTFRHNGVSDDAVKLRLFPFSLREKAKSSLSSLAPSTITTWDDLAQKFLVKFFPPAKTAKLRNDIATFTQFGMESLYKAWERYKEMMRRCPHHGLPKWLQVQTFYNGLGASTRTLVDIAAGGALMARPPPGFQPQEKKVNLEEALTQLTVNTSKFMTKTEMTLQNQTASIRNLEVQVGQLASMMTERQQGSLLSNTETNPKEQVKAIPLRSGKQLKEPQGKMRGQKEGQSEVSASNQAKTEEEVGKKGTGCTLDTNKEGTPSLAAHETLTPQKKSLSPPPYVPSIPFPQRLRKNKLDKQFSKFLDVFKKLYINIPFTDALEQMPSYVKL